MNDFFIVVVVSVAAIPLDMTLINEDDMNEFEETCKTIVSTFNRISSTQQIKQRKSDLSKYRNK